MYVPKRLFPASSSDFETIREEDMYYVDKTDLAWRIAREHRVAFLSRPRRFGKSMLLSTLAYYFEGRRDLFDGLRIVPLEEQRGAKAWTKHPVLRFDFSGILHVTIEHIEVMMRNVVNAELYRLGMDELPDDEPLDVQKVGNSLIRKTGQKLVVLIDEYDSPLLDAMLDGNLPLFDEIRAYLR
ncbi:MAG: AAA family ATPase, partial [Bacteroidetes bacterium]